MHGQNHFNFIILLLVAEAVINCFFGLWKGDHCHRASDRGRKWRRTSRVHNVGHLHIRQFHSRDRNIVAQLVKSVVMGSVVLLQVALDKTCCVSVMSSAATESFVTGCCKSFQIKRKCC